MFIKTQIMRIMVVSPPKISITFHVLWRYLPSWITSICDIWSCMNKPEMLILPSSQNICLYQTNMSAHKEKTNLLFRVSLQYMPHIQYSNQTEMDKTKLGFICITWSLSNWWHAFRRKICNHQFSMNVLTKHSICIDTFSES